MADTDYYLVGYSGVAAAIVFSSFGAVYGSAKSAAGILQLGTYKPNFAFKAFIPVVMSGILAIYGLIVAVILSNKITSANYSEAEAYSHLASGLTVGLTCLGSGIGLGVIGNRGAKAMIQEEKMYISMILMLIFAQALGLYGLILSLILAGGDNSQ